jgi:hypothetical protein
MVVGKKDDGLDDYCKNYKFKRIQIEKESEISPILVKKFIISLIYGGTFPTEKMIDGNSAKWIVDKVDVADEFIMHHGNERDGIESLKKLIQSKTLVEFKNTIDHVLKEIKLVSKTKNIYGGYGKDNVYINPRYRIATIENKQNKILTHLFQGIESLALKTIIQNEPNNIVALFHDGWIEKERGSISTEEYIKVYKDKIYKETKERMEEWNRKVGNPLVKPDGFWFNFSHRKIEGKENIRCEINSGYEKVLIGQIE